MLVHVTGHFFHLNLGIYRVAYVARANERLEPHRRCLDDSVAPKAAGIVMDRHDDLIHKL